MKYITLLFLFFVPTMTWAQSKLKSIEALTQDTTGWPVLKEWITSAKNTVEVLTADPTKAKESLLQAQVTTHSIMGAVIYFTGGIKIDNGWIRILGSGNDKLKRNLMNWNKGRSFSSYGEKPLFLLVADDVAGGFFAINGGSLGKDLGNIYYLAPDTLDWESLNMGYSDFINFCLNGDLNKFYNNLRWPNWQSDIKTLTGDQVFSFYPFLWTKEGRDISHTSKKIIPVEEAYSFAIDQRRQLTH